MPKDIPRDMLADIEVCLSESKWIMNRTVALTLGLMTVGHLLLTLYLLRRAGLIQIGKSCVDADDDFKELIEDDDRQKFTIKLIFKCVVHNFDMLSDWLYLLTVPAYNSTIKVLLIIFILLPLLPIVCMTKKGYPLKE